MGHIEFLSGKWNVTFSLTCYKSIAQFYHLKHIVGSDAHRQHGMGMYKFLDKKCVCAPQEMDSKI